jgi:hypothetical protein
MPSHTPAEQAKLKAKELHAFQTNPFNEGGFQDDDSGGFTPDGLEEFLAQEQLMKQDLGALQQPDPNLALNEDMNGPIDITDILGDGGGDFEINSLPNTDAPPRKGIQAEALPVAQPHTVNPAGQGGSLLEEDEGDSIPPTNVAVPISNGLNAQDPHAPGLIKGVDLLSNLLGVGAQEGIEAIDTGANFLRRMLAGTHPEDEAEAAARTAEIQGRRGVKPNVGSMLINLLKSRNGGDSAFSSGAQGLSSGVTNLGEALLKKFSGGNESAPTPKTTTRISEDLPSDVIIPPTFDRSTEEEKQSRLNEEEYGYFRGLQGTTDNVPSTTLETNPLDGQLQALGVILPDGSLATEAQVAARIRHDPEMPEKLIGMLLQRVQDLRDAESAEAQSVGKF